MLANMRDFERLNQIEIEKAKEKGFRVLGTEEVVCNDISTPLTNTSLSCPICLKEYKTDKWLKIHMDKKGCEKNK